MRLSVVMIVKNEEKMLAKALESVKEADEIIICDTGSEDKTVEIAKKYTDKVYTDYKWEDSFCKARNHSLSKATGDWVLTVDADEILEEGGIKAIKEAIKKATGTRLNVTLKAASGTNTLKFPRVFKNCPEIKWAGDIHNHLVGGTVDPTIIPTTVYYNYSPAHKKDPDRTIRILTKVVNTTTDCVREKYYLAREYVYRSDWTQANEWYDKYLKVATWNAEKADAWLMKAKCLWNLRRGEEARDACLQAIKVNADFKEALLLMASMCGPQNKDSWVLYAELALNEQVLFKRAKPEQNAEYYAKIIKKDAPRYDAIRKMVGKWVGDKKILDVGCGQGCLSKHIKNYDGFDIIDNPFRKGNAYAPFAGNYDAYVILEVLEHVDDFKVLKNIPSGAEVIFSVPSFEDVSHLRVYSYRSMILRYLTQLQISETVRFNWEAEKRLWLTSARESINYILLNKAVKI